MGPGSSKYLAMFFSNGDQSDQSQDSVDGDQGKEDWPADRQHHHAPPEGQTMQVLLQIVQGMQSCRSS